MATMNESQRAKAWQGVGAVSSSIDLPSCTSFGRDQPGKYIFHLNTPAALNDDVIQWVWSNRLHGSPFCVVYHEILLQTRDDQQPKPHPKLEQSRAYFGGLERIRSGKFKKFCCWSLHYFCCNLCLIKRMQR